MTDEKIKEEMPEMEILEGQPCPMCQKNTLTLNQAEREVPYFGKVFLFGMTSPIVPLDFLNFPCKYSSPYHSEPVSIGFPLVHLNKMWSSGCQVL